MYKLTVPVEVEGGLKRLLDDFPKESSSLLTPNHVMLIYVRLDKIRTRCPVVFKTVSVCLRRVKFIIDSFGSN